MRRINRRRFLGECGGGAAGLTMLAQTGNAQAPEAAVPTGNPVLVTDREDGRFVDTIGFLQAHMKNNPPKLAFDPSMDAADFPVWKAQIREKMLELLAFSEVSDQPPPKRIWKRERDGYTLYKWEAYPEPYCVVPFLMLVPHGVSSANPAPAVMCFPGSSGSKEGLAGEPELPGFQPKDVPEWKRRDNQMALHFVNQGFVAVAMDNPAKAEPASAIRNFIDASAMAIWLGRNYLGLSVFQKAHVLEWLAEQDFVDNTRIATCGHSLGSDPADALGVLYPHRVAAVIHNDFCCDWRERSIAMNAYPGGLHHNVPGMFRWYDAPDLQASLAPMPLLFTEGGRTVHLRRIQAAYQLAGAPDNVKIHYYKKHLTPDLRPLDDLPLPEGLTSEEYLQYANVDVPFHCFRPKRAVPWLMGQFGMGKPNFDNV